MCMGGSPAPAPLPPPPPPPPVPPTPGQEAEQIINARKRERQIAQLAAGRESNIGTTSQGLTSEATSAKKTALGS